MITYIFCSFSLSISPIFDLHFQQCSLTHIHSLAPVHTYINYSHSELTFSLLRPLHTHTVQTAPSFFTLSAFADTQFKQPPPFLLSLPSQTHSSSEKNTNRSYSLFSLNVKSHNFHLFSINKSQIQHFIQQMQNNNPTPQIKRLQQFTQQFHMANIYNCLQSLTLYIQ